MGILNKKSTALAMLGSLDNVRQLVGLFGNHGITLVEKDYVTVDELIEGVKDYKNVEYILISDTALSGIDDGKFEAIKAIRNVYENILIAMFFNFEKPDNKFKNWAFGYGVYNIYYAADNNGNYNFTEIMPSLVEKAMPTKNGKIQVVEKEVPVEKIVEKEVVREVRVEVPVEKEVIKEVRIEVPVEKEVEKIKEIVKYIERPSADVVKIMSSILIGVFSVSSGAGATRTSIKFAESFAKDGFSSVVIAYDGKRDLHYKKRGRADHIVPASPGDKKLRLLDVLKRGYQFIILDFGNLFNITPEGHIDASTLTSSKEDIEEFLRCQYKVGVGFSDDWHVGKLNYFIDNDAFQDTNSCIFCIEGIDSCKAIDKFDLNICERDSDIMLDIMYEWIGLQRQEKMQRMKKSKLFSRNGEGE